MFSRIFVPFLLLFALLAPLKAAVDLVTLPTREGTQLTIYNSEDITMVREHRLLTVKEGVNRIQFAWANTLIDPTSIEFRILDKQDKVDLVDTTFPAGRNDALQWNVKSQIAGKEKKLSGMENLGLSPLPNGTVRLFSEYKNRDLAYVGGTETKYVPIGDRVEVNVGPDKDITIQRRVKNQKIANLVARQYKRRLDDKFVLYYDLVDYDETFFYEEELVSGKPVPAKIEVERQFDANVVLWGEGEEPKGWTSNEPGAYVDLHTAGHVERADQQHVKYFMDLKPGKKQRVAYSVTYKRRKVGPELNTEKRREPL